jgi:hypothetical protein
MWKHSIAFSGQFFLRYRRFAGDCQPGDQSQGPFAAIVITLFHWFV